MSQAPSPTSEQQLLTARIVHVALCVGALAANVVLYVVALTVPRPNQGAQPILAWIGVAAAVLGVAMSVLVPHVYASSWRSKIAQGGWPFDGVASGSETAWWSLHGIQSLVGLAMLEGAAFFQAVAYFVDRQPFSLGVAAALLVVLLTRFPTRAGIENWVTSQREQIEMMKQDRR